MKVAWAKANLFLTQRSLNGAREALGDRARPATSPQRAAAPVTHKSNEQAHPWTDTDSDGTS